MSVERRVTPSGQVRWDVRGRHADGRQYSRTFPTKKAAQQFQASERIDQAQGTWIDPQAGRIPMADWATEWFRSNEHSWRPATIQRNRVALFGHWVPRLGTVPMRSISPRQVQGVVNELVLNLAPVSVRGYYGTARTMFADAVDMDLIGRSPCRGIKLPPAKSKQKRVIGPKEVHRLADAIGPDWRAIVYLGGVMGLRFGEAAALRLSDVDFDEGRVLISRALSEVDGRLEIGPPKTTAGVRALDIPGPLVIELRAHVERKQILPADALLFADGSGGPIRRSNFRKRVFEPAVESARLTGLTFHGLRHSAATRWMTDGTDARTVQRMLGHSDPRLVLKLYAHAADEAIKAAAERTADSYWGANGKLSEMRSDRDS